MSSFMMRCPAPLAIPRASVVFPHSSWIGGDPRPTRAAPLWRDLYPYPRDSAAMPSNPPDPYLVSREQCHEKWVTPGVLILTRGLPKIE
jgi:hypothetical protein